MNTVAQPQRKFCFRGRSFIAFTLTPQPPIVDWLVDLDEWVSNSPSFFIGQPIVLDLGVVDLSESALAHLIEQLTKRSIRVMGLTGVDQAAFSEKMPPILRGGWATGVDETPAKKTASADESKPSSSVQREPASLLLETPIRSGQTVNFPSGDVTILGSVASGAEIVAGGSIHVYGTLRGRAMAGSQGNTRARIFCRRNEAELLAIDGCFRTAETIAKELRSRPAQAWLDDADIKIAALV